MKICIHCLMWKSIADFPTHKQMKRENKDKVAIRNARWRAAHVEQVKHANAKFRQDNKASINQVRAEWRKRNPEAEAAMGKRYNQKHPDRCNALVAARKARKLLAVPSWANYFFISEAYALARHRTEFFGFPWHVDHIVPICSDTVCGLHVEHNLQVIPARHNHVKGNRWWPDMPCSQLTP